MEVELTFSTTVSIDTDNTDIAECLAKIEAHKIIQNSGLKLRYKGMSLSPYLREKLREFKKLIKT